MQGVMKVLVTPVIIIVEVAAAKPRPNKF